MVAPSVTVNLFELAVFNPQVTEPIIGCVGPATKGPTNDLTEITDVGSFKDLFGIPADANYYAQRAMVRYLERGSNGRFVRVAGPNLASATLALLAADGLTTILRFTAASGGSWANSDLAVSITHNGTESYNVLVFFRGQAVETFTGVDNGTVVTRVNNGSNRLTVELVSGAGATFPAETINPITGGVERVPFAGGNDGALATTDSASSSTSGVAGRRFYGSMDAIAGSRVFENILTIGAAQAGLAEIRGTVGMPVTPGTFTIRVQTAAGPTFVELADDDDLSYGPGGAGVGLLAPSAGAHVGFIDYRTGNWGVQLDAATTFLTGTIDGIWVRGNTESAGATAAGQGSYAGTLSSAPMGVGFFNSNKVIFTVPIDEQVGDVPLGPAGAASSDPALKTLAGWVVPGTIKLTPSHPTDPVPPAIWDDGFGGWRTGPNGTGVPVTGTVDYRTGVWSVTTWDPVGGVLFPGVTPAQIQAEYDIQLLDMGGGPVAGPNGTFTASEVVQPSDAGGDAAAASTDPGAQNITGPNIEPGSVVLTISDVGGFPETFYDDGLGGWLDRPRGDPRAAAVAGAIDYTVGSWSITASGAITATAVIDVDYTAAAQALERRALRGTGPQFVADVTANAAGMDLTAPSSADSFNGPNWLDHGTGAFAFALDLVTTGTNTFNVRDNGTISAVYVPATIKGFGDGSQTIFTAQLGDAPYRREDRRLQGFQGAQASAAAAGDPQVTFAEAATDPADDHWLQNVAVPTDPDNFLDFRTGQSSIEWTSAPLRSESVYVVAEEIVLHFEATEPGDIGNERDTLTDGFFVDVGADPTLAGTLRARVWFGTNLEESFGQAADLQELVDDINAGSVLVTAQLTDAGVSLPPDVTAVQQCGLSGAFTVADIIGAKTGQVYTGLQSFRNFEVIDVDFLLVPGQWHRQVFVAMQDLVELPGRNAIAVISVPDLDDPLKYRDFFNGSFNAASPGGPAVPTVLVPFPPLVEINSSFLFNATPWLQNFDQDNDVTKFEPPDGDVGRLISKTPAPWQPIAGFNRGQVLSERVRYSASLEDRNLVQGLVGNRVEVVNPIIRISGRGLHLFGQQTMTRTPGSFLSRLAVRWTMNLIINRLQLVAREFQFEINDPVLWRQATARCNAVLQPILDRRGIQDAHVVIDNTTVKPEDVDALRMPGKIFVKPSLSVEFVEFDLILTPAGASFSEVVVG